MLKICDYCYDRRSRIAVLVLILLILPMLTGCKKRQDILLDMEMESESSGNMNVAGSSDNMEISENLENVSDLEEIADEKQTAVNMDVFEPEPAYIYVHICGAVSSPGVYELPAGSRVFEGIEAAGGLLETAYGDYVNQAEVLWDGQQLVIPTIEEIEIAKEDGTYEQLWANNTGNKTGFGGNEAASGDTAGMGENHNGKININTATESQLLKITGIGATRAAAIVQYRDEHGSFASIEDIMQVSGIKEGTYEKIKDEITVE